MPTLDGKEVVISVDASCIGCGACVRICACEYLELKDKKACESKMPSLGCITCGQCAAICPVGAIHVTADGISAKDIVEFSSEKPSSYEQLFRLLSARRSVRHFKAEEIAEGALTQILEAAKQSPCGLPPSSVDCIVVSGKTNVHAFAFDFLDEVKKMGWLFSKLGIWALRPFMSAEDHHEMREKVAPLYRGLMAGRAQDQDFLCYDAPLLMIFLSKGEAADAVIASTYAMIAAESLGLGSCMLGTITPMLARTSKAFRAKYNIPLNNKQGLAIAFGHPKFTFKRAIRRNFKTVTRS